MAADTPLHLAVALDGAGWHPAAWREPDARPRELLTAGYWVDLVRRAEAGLLDLVTIEDSLRLQSMRSATADGRTDQVRGRLDAVLVAARVAPVTRHVGLVPSVTVTHTEPFHISKAVATLDYVSGGRAGVRVQVSGRPDEAALIGRCPVPAPVVADRSGPEGQAYTADLFAEATDYVEVVRRLWDSWEDDAEIRDAGSGRFIDRDKLHYIDFSGRWFSVKGPSITPRPPQGQPPVVALAHAELPYRFAARSADLVLVTPRDADDARSIVDQVRAAGADGDRAREVRVWGDLVVHLDHTAQEAAARRRRLDEAAGADVRSDAAVVTATPAQLADLLVDWAAAGLRGFRLRPATVPHDLDAIVDGLVPELQARDLFRRAYAPGTLRDRLGLARPVNRYVAAGTEVP